MSKIYETFSTMLQEMKKNPDGISKDDVSMLEKLYFDICKALNFSEHSAWKVDWLLEKRHDKKDETPYEVLNDSYIVDKLAFGGNVILDTGASEMLKLIAGITGATPFNTANAKMVVGTDTTPELASQTGVIATGTNRATAGMVSGYPIVTGRTLTFRASFGNDVANFSWNEASVVNGTGTNAVGMNRKVSAMGTKTGGEWTLQITVSLVSA